MSDRQVLFELKEKAKWARDLEERKAAVKQLLSHGQDAIPSLEEILNVTAYEDIRLACAGAIRALLADSGKSIGAAGTTSDTKAEPATTNALNQEDQKKEQLPEKKGKSGEGAAKLAAS
jgi:hypothetical protein